MRELEVLLALVLAAVILAALARRAGAPYPVFAANASRSARGKIPQVASQAAREAVLGMRDNHQTGDDAFHRR